MEDDDGHEGVQEEEAKCGEDSKVIENISREAKVLEVEKCSTDSSKEVEGTVVNEENQIRVFEEAKSSHDDSGKLGWVHCSETSKTSIRGNSNSAELVEDEDGTEKVSYYEGEHLNNSELVESS